MACGASGAGARTRYNRVSVVKRNRLDSGGIVTLIQRFGSSLNLNVHLDMLVLDGVYANERGKLRLQPLPRRQCSRNYSMSSSCRCCAAWNVMAR